MDAALLQRPPLGGLKIGVRALFPLFLCAACASGGATLDAAVTAQRTLELRLYNGGASSLGYNLCTSSLERRSGQAWQPVATQRICTMELRSLKPGEEARYSLGVEDLPPGEYRATTRVEGLPAALATEPFHIP